MMTDKMYKFPAVLVLFAGIMFCFGCEKFLDAKPDKALQVPTTLADLEALMDYADDMNNASPAAQENCSDDYYLLDNTWNGLTSLTRKNLYVWESDVFNDGPGPGDWGSAYIPAYRANVVLEKLNALERTLSNAVQYDRVKGASLFFRSRAFWEALQIWAKGYDAATASSDPGVPLRLGPDFNEVSVRSSIGQCYQQVISDLKSAVRLLPVVPQHVMRPSRPAAYGMLARVYLGIGDYRQAGLYADSCLQLTSSLLDYNTLSPSAAFPVPRFNVEVVFNSVMPATTNSISGRIDSVLYQSYSEKDLRKKVYFKAFATSSGGGMGFKGSYYAANNLFNGIAVDEMMLIRAESYARWGKDLEALADLNALLVKRYVTGSYVPYTVSGISDVLGLVLKERRKELVFRGLRWPDLKRLNRESLFAMTINRVLNGVVYSLPPNDKRYAICIPNTVIAQSGIPQN